MDWMIYGANGYSGRLIVEAALKLGLRPVLAGRNAPELIAMGKQFDLPVRVFPLTNADSLRVAVSGMNLVLHCAGPFSATSAPMIEACLANGAHYLDITGEIDVFAHAYAQHARALQASVLLMPGVGFDVVPSDCLAAMLKKRLPDASELQLGFDAGGKPSPGTLATSIEGLGNGGRVRRDGELTRVPLAYKDQVREIGGQMRSAVTIPWGDVFTAWVSTGIPNIEVYMAVPESRIKGMRRLRPLQPVLGWKWVQNWMKKRALRSYKGPSEEQRQKTGVYLWGEVRNERGGFETLGMQVPNGYELTAQSASQIVKRVLSEPKLSKGFATPSMLLGADFVLSLPGVELK